MVSSEVVHPLNERALQLFAQKGSQGGAAIVQQGNANAVKIRRVMQLTRDLATKPLDHLRILDLACGEGVYSIEAALRGAEPTSALHSQRIPNAAIVQNNRNSGPPRMATPSASNPRITAETIRLPCAAMARSATAALTIPRWL